MIELYRPPECPACAEIEAALKEMVIAHKVIVVEPDGPATKAAPTVPLPALKENDRVISGQAAITAYLKALEAFVAGWQRFQSDACYCDE